MESKRRVEVWSSNYLRRVKGDRLVPGPGEVRLVRRASLVVALVAVRESVGVRVVEQRFVAVSPREALWGIKHTTPSARHADTPRRRFIGYFRAQRSDLGADAEVGVRDELGLLVAVLLLLQVHVQHAHGDTGQSHHEGQNLPGLSCNTTKTDRRSDGKNDTSVRRGKFWLQIKTAQILFQLLKLEDFLLFVSVTETDVKYFLCTSWNLYHQTLCGVWGLPERLRWWMMFSRGSEKGSRWRQIFRFLSQRTKNISHVSRWNLTDRTFTLESGRCVKVRLCSVVRLTSTHQINKRSDGNHTCWSERTEGRRIMTLWAF